MAKKFEYRTEMIHVGHDDDTAKLDKQLNALGAKGWELVGMSRDESPDDDHDEEVVLFVFKRAK
jgi:hypothetical protein